MYDIIFNNYDTTIDNQKLLRYIGIAIGVDDYDIFQYNHPGY